MFGVYTEERKSSEKVKMTYIDFAVLNSHVALIYLRFIKNSIFWW